MITVIRIEHPTDGFGIFRRKDVNDKFTYSFRRELTRKHRGFPVPDDDSLLGDIHDYEFCAFKSIEQIQQWIEPSWFNEFIELGFKIYMLDVTNYRTGEFQILYTKESIIQQKDITNLFKTT